MEEKKSFSIFGFLKSLKSRLSEKKDYQAGQNLDVPRYPPFLEGLPYHTPDEVMNSQKELIKKARYDLGLGEDFDRIVMPVLHKYVQFVHLLPASETHHHRGAGGLLRHGLETALWSAQFSLNKVFPYEGPPKNKKEHEKRWMLAAFLGGLIHDIGKPLTDMSITSFNGMHSWSPLLESLDDWAVNNNIKRYYLYWNKKRQHKEHEKLTMLVFSQVIGGQALNYISEYDKQCLSQLYDAVCGVSTQTTLAEIILRADRTSVMQDLKANRINPDEHSYGVPIERYVLDVMRQFISNNKWKINNLAGEGVVFVSEEGVFIDWNIAAQDIGRALSELHIPGIPRNKDSLADILLERGYALPHYKTAENNETLRYRYWPLEAEITSKEGVKGSSSFYALRLEEAQLIFGDTKPPLTKKVFVKQEGNSDNTEKTQNLSTDNSSVTGENHHISETAEEQILNSTKKASNQPKEDDTYEPVATDFGVLVQKLQETEPVPTPIQYIEKEEAVEQQKTNQEESQQVQKDAVDELEIEHKHANSQEAAVHKVEHLDAERSNINLATTTAHEADVKKISAVNSSTEKQKAGAESAKRPLNESDVLPQQSLSRQDTIKRSSPTSLLNKISVSQGGSLKETGVIKSSGALPLDSIVIRGAAQVVKQSDGLLQMKRGLTGSEKPKKMSATKKAAKPAAGKGVAKRKISQHQANNKALSSNESQHFAAKTATKLDTRQTVQINKKAINKTDKKNEENIPIKQQVADCNLKRVEKSPQEVLAFIVEKMSMGDKSWLADYQKHNEEVCSVDMRGTFELVSKKYIFEKKKLLALLMIVGHTKKIVVLRNRLFLNLRNT